MDDPSMAGGGLPGGNMTDAKRDARWFTNDRFGMFVHFGLYSQPGGFWKGKKISHEYSEWLQASEKVPRGEYRALADAFNPDAFDADEWISAAKDAGMRYTVITAKHHDGFALWPSKASAYNVGAATPFKRDIIGELAAACKRHGVRLGLYYSHWMDWEGTGGDVCEKFMVNEEYVHPTEAAFETYWRGKCLPQVRELLTQYDPSFLWFDTWGKLSGAYITEKRQEELISLIRSLSEKCLVNSRIRFDAPPEKADVLSMMDNTFPNEAFDKPWETSGTLNHSWAYHRGDFNWKSTRELLQYLIHNASFGGNYQLNVGPTGEGRFQPAALRRLKEIGAWLSVNSEAIYGTEKSPFPKPEWGRVTSKRESGKASILYLHLFKFTPGAAVTVGPLRHRPRSVRVLESGQELSFQYDPEKGLAVELPVDLQGLEIPVIRVECPEGAF